MSTTARQHFTRALLLATLLCGGAHGAYAAASDGEAAVEGSDVAGATVDTLTITARRRAETVQSAPLAVSVVGGDRLDGTGSFNVGRLQQLTPTLQFYSSNPRNTSVNIRGLGAPFGLTSDGFEQGVGIYVDDVYNSRVATATFDFLDVDRIEVLRGPQGTLYGKNTTAGAINITTRQPTFDFQGSAEISVGDLEFKQAKAAISGPLSDKVAARLAVSSTHRRGTIYNVTSSRYINEQDNLGLRGQLLFKPSEDLSITLAGDYSRQNPEGFAQIYVRVGATQRALNRQYAALTAALGYAVPSTDPFARVTDVDAELNAGNKIGGVSAKAVWNVAGGTLTSVTAWRFWDWKPQNDRDFLGLSIVAKSQNPSQQDQYSQELRYNRETKAYDLVVGAFAFQQRIDTQGTEQQGTAASRWNIAPSNALSNDPTVLAGLTAKNVQWLKSKSLAVFGQLSWKVTDAFTLTPGARLNYDQKSGYYERKVYDGQGVPVLITDTGARRAAQLAIYTPQVSAPSFDDWNFAYDLTASYQAGRDVLAYATYAKSFKTGGINQNGLPTDAAGNPIAAAGVIKPEDINHFEGGLKTQWLNRTLTANLAVFRTDIKDYQATVTNGQLGVLRGYLANAGKVRTQGVELDSAYRPNARFSAYLNGAYTDAKYVRFVDAPCPPELSGGATATGSQTPGAPGVAGALSPPNCDISGQRLPGVSKWSFAFGAEANTPGDFLGKTGEFYFGYDGSYRSRFSSNPSPSAYTWVDGYAIANFRAGFRTPEGLNIYGWVRNAFDQNYFEFLAVGPSNTGLIAGQPGDPRTWGVTVRAAF
ncbi:TonB-dependent receptor [uncultured Caulobacter sp.]|uniref:TonB-dependent receptor n=1 Tax=uncultured Caulobacter sp. TaxID=158749 RepID=UPI00345DCA50